MHGIMPLTCVKKTEETQENQKFCSKLLSDRKELKEVFEFRDPEGWRLEFWSSENGPQK